MGTPFHEALIVTDSIRNNPCIATMRDHFPGQVFVQSGTLHEDFCTLLSAPKVALSMSSFSLMALTLNGNLTDVYVPFAFDSGTSYPGGFEKWWRNYAWSETPASYNQHLYSFAGYDPRQRYMSYPVGKFVRRTIVAMP